MPYSATAEDTFPAPQAAAAIAARLLAWHHTHGRHDLPWQRDITPYRVWVSEIMLQQTQVATVIPYFERFMRRFPDIRALAEATEDEVLHHWTGLGYYARARNLHRAARIVRDQYQGEFPRSPEQIAALPGIGRSTAGAIVAIALGERAAILDGNVKRVLARLFAVEGHPAQAATAQRLWALAERLTPARDAADYTQAVMDLGATLCTRSRPACARCPLAGDCAAHARGAASHYPQPRSPRRVPVRSCRMLVIRNAEDEFLLEKRPLTGIWGGLWSFPETAVDEDPVSACLRIAGELPGQQSSSTAFRHTFSHFHLDVQPVLLRVTGTSARVLEGPGVTWYKPGTQALGLAAPVKRLIESLATTNQPGETPAP